MIKFEELEKIVKSSLSFNRYEHTMRVVKKAVEYASFFNIDIERVKLTALAHDIAKELKDYDNYCLDFDEYEKKNNSLKHAKVGSIICKEYGFDDEMLAAIRFHTTGRENMSLLEKIIFLADSTEEKKSCSIFSYLVKENIDYAIVKVTMHKIKKVLENENIIHINTVKCYNFYNMLCK